MWQELQPDDPGRIGPYRLRGILGFGGMGRVFLGASADGQVAVWDFASQDRIIRGQLPTLDAINEQIASSSLLSGAEPLERSEPDGSMPT